MASDPSADLAANAIEELLRYEAPSPVQGRRTMTDIRRQMKNHLSFGYGIHFCMPNWKVDPEGMVRQHTSTVRGFSQVMVEPGA